MPRRLALGNTHLPQCRGAGTPGATNCRGDSCFRAFRNFAAPTHGAGKTSAGPRVAGETAACGSALPAGRVSRQEETCERWNDWAAAQFTAGQLTEAEHAFRYALELDPENREVSGNLGVLLVECQRENEAIPFLARHAREARATPCELALRSQPTPEILTITYGMRPRSWPASAFWKICCLGSRKRTLTAATIWKPTFH